jgi:hypothetical protein
MRPWTHSAREVQSLEEFIQFTLIGTFDKVGKKTDQYVKGQFTVAGEMCFCVSMASNKTLRMKKILD